MALFFSYFDNEKKSSSSLQYYFTWCPPKYGIEIFYYEPWKVSSNHFESIYQPNTEKRQKIILICCVNLFFFRRRRYFCKFEKDLAIRLFSFISFNAATSVFAIYSFWWCVSSIDYGKKYAEKQSRTEIQNNMQIMATRTLETSWKRIIRIFRSMVAWNHHGLFKNASRRHKKEKKVAKKYDEAWVMPQRSKQRKKNFQAKSGQIYCRALKRWANIHEITSH